MDEKVNDRIILCQPDGGKGCSLCCGLFNFRDLSSANLTEFLEGGKKREKTYHVYDEFETPSGIRDEFSHICPYQGFLSGGKPGCLIHPLYAGFDDRGRSLFAGRICGGFFCPAHEVLTDEEKTFLIKNVLNWYIYSIAVADPESYSYIYNYVKHNYSDADCRSLYGKLVNEGLAAHAENLTAYEGAVFCYSIPEYNICKRNFCINYIDRFREPVVSRIDKAALTVI